MFSDWIFLSWPRARYWWIYPCSLDEAWKWGGVDAGWQWHPPISVETRNIEIVVFEVFIPRRNKCKKTDWVGKKLNSGFPHTMTLKCTHFKNEIYTCFIKHFLWKLHAENEEAAEAFSLLMSWHTYCCLISPFCVNTTM